MTTPLVPLALLHLASSPSGPPGEAAWTALGMNLVQESQEPRQSSFDYDYVEGAFALGDPDGVRVGGSGTLRGTWTALSAPST